MVQSHQRNRPGVPGTAYPKDHFHSSIPAPRGCTGLPCSRHPPDSRALCTVACRALKSNTSQDSQWQAHKRGNLLTSSRMRKIFLYSVMSAMQGCPGLGWCLGVTQPFRRQEMTLSLPLTCPCPQHLGKDTLCRGESCGRALYESLSFPLKWK